MGLFNVLGPGSLLDRDRRCQGGQLPELGFNTDMHTRLQLKAMQKEEAKANSRAMMEKERQKYQAQMVMKKKLAEVAKDEHIFKRNQALGSTISGGMRSNKFAADALPMDIDHDEADEEQPDPAMQVRLRSALSLDHEEGDNMTMKVTKMTRATSKFWVGANQQEVILNPAEGEGWMQDSGRKSMKRMVHSGSKSGKNMWISSPSARMSSKHVLLIDQNTGVGWLGRTKNFMSGLTTKLFGGGGGAPAAVPPTAAERMAKVASKRLPPDMSSTAAPSRRFAFGSTAAPVPDPRKLPSVGGANTTAASVEDGGGGRAAIASRVIELTGTKSAPVGASYEAPDRGVGGRGTGMNWRAALKGGGGGGATVLPSLAETSQVGTGGGWRERLTGARTPVGLLPPVNS